MSAASPPHAPPPGPTAAPRAALSVPVLFAMVIASQLALTVFLPAVPAIAADLDTSLSSVQTIIPVYLGAFAVTQLFMGPLSDTFGRRPVVLLGLALFTVASIACALAPDIATLMAARAVQAMGACATLVVGRATIRDTAEGVAAARAMSVLAIAMGIGPAVAPFMGGILVTEFDWRATFYATGLLSGGVFVMAWIMLRETLPADLRQPPRIGTQLRNYATILRIPAFVGYSLTISFASAAMQSFLTATPVVMITLMGVPPWLYGLYVMIVPVVYMTATVTANLLTRIMPVDRIVLIGALFSATGGMTQLTLGLIGVDTAPPVLIAFCISNFGTGLLLANCYAQALNTVTPSVAGAASALSGTMHIGWAFCVSMVVANVTHTSSLQLGIAQSSTTALSLATALVLIFVIRRRPRTAAD